MSVLRDPIQMSEKQQGIVKWFNDEKGFGFISRENGSDLFVHYKSISGEGRRTLVEGQAVEFAEGQGPKGPQAEEVVSI